MFRSSIRRIIPTLSKATLAPKAALCASPSFLTTAPAKCFSTTRVCGSSSGLVDADLKKALATELKYEQEEGEVEMSEETTKYIQELPFKITDKPGEDEVKLVRTFGNETVQLSFSIKDIQAPPPSVLSEDEDRDQSPQDFPTRIRIDIIKDAGVLNIEAIIEEGEFHIEMVNFFKDSKVALADNSEGEWKRHSIYGGPIFQDLDEDVQLHFERYIEERGITTDLAHFIPNYIQYKEQKEYMLWLERVHNFVKA